MTIRINGEIIPEEAIRVELRRLVQFYSEHMPGQDLRGQMAELVRKAKEQAIGAKLLLLEAQKRAIPVEGKDIEARLRDVADRSGGEADFEKLLQKQGLSREALRESVRQGVQVDRLIEEITAGIGAPTEEEARKYYDRHREDYRTGDQAKVRHILIKPQAESEEERAIARAKLLGFKRQIEAGEDFGKLARTWSECPSGAQSGGLLGWITRGTTLPEFDAAVFAMAVGQISGVVETSMGMHIVQAVDRVAGREAQFDEVKDQILDLIRHTRRGHAIAKFVEGLRAAAAVDDDDEEAGFDSMATEEDDEEE